MYTEDKHGRCSRIDVDREPMTCTAKILDARRIVTTSYNGTARVWEAATAGYRILLPLVMKN
jgi:hypothetical protein